MAPSPALLLSVLLVGASVGDDSHLFERVKRHDIGVFTCPKPDGIFESTLLCHSSYFRCKSGRAEKLQCEDGLIFDGSTKSCRASTEVKDCLSTGRRKRQFFVCPRDHGNFPDYEAGECSKTYYLCYRGSFLKQKCLNDEIFDVRHLQCELPDFVETCGGDSHFDCAKKENKMYQQGCSRFFWWCWAEKPSRHVCNVDRYFNEENQQCDFKDRVAACSPNYVPPVAPPTAVVAIKAIPKLEIELISAVAPESDVIREHAVDCSTKANGNYPDPGNPCAKYFFTCSNRQVYKSDCPASLYYNASIDSCVKKIDVLGCIGVPTAKWKPLGLLPNVDPSTLTGPTDHYLTADLKVDCAHLPDGKYKDPLNLCVDYYHECQNKKLFMKACANPLVFNPEKQTCSNKSAVIDCQREPPLIDNQHLAPVKPIDGLNINLYPKINSPAPPKHDVIDCSVLADGDYSIGCANHFYTCSNNIGVQRPCPEDLFFENSTDKCLHRHEVPACGGVLPSSRSEINEKSSVCPHSDGDFAHPRLRCSRTYIRCTDNRWTTATCPNERHIFNPSVKSCTNANQVFGCEDPTFCVGKETNFKRPVPESRCSPVYLVCVHDEVVYQPCASPLIFSKYTGNCEWARDVPGCNENAPVNEPRIAERPSTSNVDQTPPVQPVQHVEHAVSVNPANPNPNPGQGSNYDQFCRDKEDGSYELQPCYQTYVKCEGNTASEMICDQGEVFDDENGRCEPRKGVKACAGAGRQITPKMEKPDPEPYDAPTTINPRINQGPCATWSNGLHALSDCNQHYIRCNNGATNYQTCQQGWIFDPIRKSCAPRDAVQSCGTDEHIYHPTPVPVTPKPMPLVPASRAMTGEPPGNYHAGCLGKHDGYNVQIEPCSRTYGECVGGYVRLRQCQEDQLFSNSLRKCQPAAWMHECSQQPKTPTNWCQDKPNGNYPKSPCDNEFVTCWHGQDHPTKCAEPSHVFNPANSKCQPPSTVPTCQETNQKPPPSSWSSPPPPQPQPIEPTPDSATGDRTLPTGPANGDERCTGKLEMFTQCGGSCAPTCANPRPVCDSCLPGCQCRFGYVRDAQNGCVPLSECNKSTNRSMGGGGQTPRCRYDETYTVCGLTCQPTCRSPHPDCKRLGCQPGCQCSHGLLRVSNGMCVPKHQCAAEERRARFPAPSWQHQPRNDSFRPPNEPRPPPVQCRKDNEIYSSCASRCQPTCQDLHRQCNKQCSPGCQCKAGYVRTWDGNCVLPWMCPTRPSYGLNPRHGIGFEGDYYAKYVNGIGFDDIWARKLVCKDHLEIFSPCGGLCEASCQDPNPRCVFTACYSGCKCKSGYVRLPNGQCGPLLACQPSDGQNAGHQPTEQCRRPHEVMAPCGASCQPTCRTPKPQCDRNCQPGCACVEGYVRSWNGECQPESACFESLPSAISQCSQNEIYTMCDACEPSCSDPDTVCPEQCLPGCRCSPGFTRLAPGVCVRNCRGYVENTRRLPGLGEDHRLTEPNRYRLKKPQKELKCEGPNEVYSKCHGLCTQSCFETPVCPAGCHAGCRCANGYARSSSGECIPQSSCHEEVHSNNTGLRGCWREHEVYSECDAECQPTCENVENFRCRPSRCSPGCTCSFGYVRGWDGSCVLSSDCSDDLLYLRRFSDSGEVGVYEPEREEFACIDANEEYNGCDCEVRCVEPRYRRCHTPCRSGCRCRPGYFRSSEGRCVEGCHLDGLGFEPGFYDGFDHDHHEHELEHDGEHGHHYPHHHDHHDHFQDLDEFFCGGHDDGDYLLPDVDCNRHYYRCEGHRVRFETCAPNQIFEKEHGCVVRRQCGRDWRDDGEFDMNRLFCKGRADRSYPLPGRSCTGSYYTCRDQHVQVRQCRKNLVFSYKSNRCVPSSACVVEKEDLDEMFCGGRSRGLYAYPGKFCSRLYFGCDKDGYVTYHLCAKDEAFLDGRCKAEKLCEERRPSTPVPPAEPVSSFFTCEGRPDGNVSRSGDVTICQSDYVRCRKGKDRCRRCPANMIFDPLESACITLNPCCEQIKRKPYLPSNDDSEEALPVYVGPKPLQDESQCGDVEGPFPMHSESMCRTSYIQCSGENGNGTIVKCENGYFDPLILRCLPMDRCCQPPPVATTPEPKTVFCKDRTDGFYALHGECSKDYMSCKGGQGAKYSCKGDWVIDLKKKMCRSRSDVPACLADNPDVLNEEETIKYKSKCKGKEDGGYEIRPCIDEYLFCQNEQASVKRCPRQKIFKDRQCVNPQTDRRCRYKVSNFEIPDSFCFDHEDGKYPLAPCSSDYIVCRHQNTHRDYCESGYVFDPIEYECVPKDHDQICWEVQHFDNDNSFEMVDDDEIIIDDFSPYHGRRDWDGYNEYYHPYGGEDESRIPIEVSPIWKPENPGHIDYVGQPNGHYQPGGHDQYNGNNSCHHMAHRSRVPIGPCKPYYHECWYGVFQEVWCADPRDVFDEVHLVCGDHRQVASCNGRSQSPNDHNGPNGIQYYQHNQTEFPVDQGYGYGRGHGQGEPHHPSSPNDIHNGAPDDHRPSDGICGNKKDGSTVSLGKCKQEYASCWRGMAIQQVCQYGYAFNEMIGKCVDRGELADCRSAPPVPVAPELPKEILGFCEGLSDGYYRHPTDCTRFIQCTGRQARVMLCDNGLVFNPAPGVLACDYPRRVPECSNHVVNEADGHRDAACEDLPDGAFIRDMENCSRFSRCIDGQLRHFECQGVQVFNPRLNVCDYVANVPSCIKSH